MLGGCSDNTLENKLVFNTKASCSSLGEDIISCDTKEAICLGEDINFNDISGDAGKSFVDLTEIGMTLGNECIGVSWTMNDLPEVLTIDHAALELYANNYSWLAYFDIDGDCQPSKGDLFISIDKDKFEKQPEKTIPISKFADGSLAEIESITDNGQLEVKTKLFVSTRVSNNTLTVYLPKALNSNLTKITKSTTVHFTAQFNDGKNQYIDYFPNNQSFCIREN
ncbi:hypothetical protein C8D91_0332 [Marinicella litoralis]|uniref:Uncharacterized protein n=2 Tax=Marinicella litoralis TaxID=644220 RepID=A0A4V3DIW6_9GAMM|nr:hypothetical protein C8D91_0332 [Marinicella litoralis]